MTFASILCVIDGESGSEGALAAAFALGRRFNAYLEVLHVEPNPEDTIPLVGEGMSGVLVEQVSADLRASAERAAAEARRLFDAQCAAGDVKPVDADEYRATGKFVAAWRHITGREDRETAQRGLLFDLIVVQRPSSEADGAYAPALEAGLFETGRPVLVAPPSVGEDFGKSIVIAWRATREASEAVSAALPMLVAASEVKVLSLKEAKSEEDDPRALVRYLALHGVEARPKVVEPSDSHGASLLAEASELGADLLVMGAYGHSRLREFVLGGVTRSVLTSASIPVLMAH
jgi:nucleotide-binding universal stress UspA family protein